MNKKYSWLPIDERLVPNIFSFTYPKSWWVRTALFIEMTLAVLALIGTLILAIMLPQQRTTSEINTVNRGTDLLPSPGN